MKRPASFQKPKSHEIYAKKEKFWNKISMVLGMKWSEKMEQIEVQMKGKSKHVILVKDWSDLPFYCIANALTRRGLG